MKKAGVSRFVTFVLCISLFANILSGHVMAMDGGNQVRGEPQEVTELSDEVNEPGENTEELADDTEEPEENTEELAGNTEEPEESTEELADDTEEPEESTEEDAEEQTYFSKLKEILLTIPDYEEMQDEELQQVIEMLLIKGELQSNRELYELLEEELSYIYEELKESESFDEMSEEEKQLYIVEALQCVLQGLLYKEISLLNVSGNINLGQFNSGGEIILGGDATANGVCTLSSGTLTIDLNGHTLTMANNAYFMLNGENAVLNIKDSAGGGIIYASCRLIWGYNGGTVNLYGGILDGSKVKSAGQRGGCIELGRSNRGNHTVNMYGGIIRNFKATQYGGAVYVAEMFSGKKNTFNMYGGTIEDCSAPAGSAVYIGDSGDGPGYFYIKGGTRQTEGGEPKAVIRCTDGPNAIYNYGYLGMEGVVDIDGIVYLNQNNWASTTTHFIKITGRLVVTGDGYIDIDSAYPNSNAVCPGHTVVENVTQTEETGSVTISQEEFYTYGSYFVNTTKGLMVSAGYDPGKNTLDRNGAPANWPTYQGDKYNQKYKYTDVMGQEMLIQSSDSPGSKREMQNYNYLIYTERADPSIPYKEYYSVQIRKADMDSGAALNNAEFQLVRTHNADGIELETPEVIGSSAPTGDATRGLDSGMTYIYLPGFDGKLMIEDGIYELRETKAPDGYLCRDSVVSLHIYHKINEENGKEVSVVEVRVNGKILSTEEQEINSTYHDSGWMVEREIVLKINNTTSEIKENTDYKVRVEKYEEEDYTSPLAGASFEIQTGEGMKKASCTTDENGIGNFLDENGSEFTFSNGEQFLFTEISAPENYFPMDEKFQLKVDENGQVWINNVNLSEGNTAASGVEGNSPAHGTWSATLQEDWITIRVYDEKMPPTWKLQAVKYGTKREDILRLAGVKFTLFQVETEGDQTSETEVISVTSSDGTDGHRIGDLVFVDTDGQPLELSCNAVYLLRETYAPMGYTLIDDIRMEVNEDGTVITVTKDGETYAGASYDAANRVLTLSIVDETVYRMPETGKGGMYPLLASSVVLMYGSLMTGYFLFGKKYRKEKQE